MPKLPARFSNLFRKQNPKTQITPMKDARDDDIIIPIMGPTGSGKSTFINFAAGMGSAVVSSGLESCTREIQTVIVPYPCDKKRRVVFVDTPGFSDTSLDDFQVLELIAEWLASSYKNGKKLAGIIYLHDITLPRMFRPLQKNLVIFGKLCGNDALNNVILATTKWGIVQADVGENREESLRNNYWKEMQNLGSHMDRFNDSPESAWKFVEHILGKDHMYALLIQEELVDLRRLVPETRAGIAVRSALEESIQTLKGRMTREQTADPLQDLEEQMVAIHDQLLRLNMPLARRIETFFSFRRPRASQQPV